MRHSCGGYKTKETIEMNLNRCFRTYTTQKTISLPPPSGVKTIYPHNIALHSTLTKIWCQFTATKNCKQNLSWYTYNLTYKQTRWTKRQNLFTLLLLIKQKYNSYKVIDPGNPPLGAWTFSSSHVGKPWANIHRKT